jgi:predicted HicB family RNase H-like nuclease
LSDIYTEPSSTKDDSTRTQKTRSITFRLDSSVIDEMQREADQKETSLNVLVNQVLKRYTEWDRYETKIGMMPVPNSNSQG